MRVIAGKYRSRTLHSLPGLDIRPTSDRLRETLFNVFTAGNPSALEGTVWLDLFAGTGAVGIEAISRGAKYVYFVENSSAAADVIEKNLRGLGVSSGFRLMRDAVARALPHLKKQDVCADVVFLDPPYRLTDAYASTLGALAGCSLIGTGSVVIAEHEKKFDPGQEFAGLRRYRLLTQGSAALSFYRLESANESQSEACDQPT